MNVAGSSRLTAVMAGLLLLVTAAMADEPPPLDFPRDALGQVYPGLADVTEPLSRAADDYINADMEREAELAGKLQSLLLDGKARVAQSWGASSREMASFLRDTMVYWSILSDIDAFLSQARSAIVLEHQFAAHRIFFGLRESSGDLLALDSFLHTAFEDARYADEDGAVEDAARLREAAFELVQYAFISRGSRNAIRKLRLDPEEPQKQLNADVMETVRTIEPLAADWGYVSALSLDENDPARKAAEDRILKQEDIVGQAFARLRQSGTDLAAILFPRALSYQQLAGHLRPDQGLLVIYAGPGKADVFLATTEGLSWHRTQAMWPELSARVASFRRSMGVTLARGASAMDETGDETPVLDQFSADSAWLYEQLLGPFRKQLIAKPHLIVAATGIVSSIPLSALLMSEPSPGDDYAKMNWLVRRHSVQVLPAVELLAGEPERLVRGEASYLGFADPDYRGITADIAPRRSRMLPMLRALPETGDEVRAIAAAFVPARVKLFLGLEANEQNLQRLSDSGELSRYAVVHFATHGLLPGEAEISADQALALSPRLEGSESLSGWIESVTPAGSYKSFPDGLLTDREILGLKMNADLVLLSACNTGIASSMNLDDGFSGISAAFLAAGSRSVMASYWPIDTNAAVELVRLAVPTIMRGEPPAVALQNAMLTLIEKGGNSADPRYWAPLAVYGQP